MDTAKVDIRKLQLLNDRINQCIDALSQVRLSVHGLSHSSQQQAQGGFAGQGLPWGQQQGYGQQPFGQQGFGYPGLGQPQAQGFGGFPQGGFAHTSGGQQPFAPFQQGLQMQGAPWQQGQGFGGQQQGFGGQQQGFGGQQLGGQQASGSRVALLRAEPHQPGGGALQPRAADRSVHGDADRADLPLRPATGAALSPRLLIH